MVTIPANDNPLSHASNSMHIYIHVSICKISPLHERPLNRDRNIDGSAAIRVFTFTYSLPALLDALLRLLTSLFVFFFLWLITRVAGRATLGELSTFELLLYVTMGDLVQQAVTQQDYSVTSAVLAVGVFTLLTVGLSWTSWRWPRRRSSTFRRTA